MKKIKIFLLLLISCFIFSMARVKADATFQYCQYDIKDGVPYIIGDCDHYYLEKQDRNTFKVNGCSYERGEHYNAIYEHNDVNVFNSNTNFECSDSIIFGGLYGSLDVYHDGSYIIHKLFANKKDQLDRNSEYSYNKYYHSGGYSYFNYVYYCKVGSISWCMPPNQNSEKYYSVLQEASTLTSEDDREFTELRCNYQKDEDEDTVYCNTSTGECMMFDENDREVYVDANVFMSEGHYYCPRVKRTTKGVKQDVLSQLFQTSQPENKNHKYCKYPILKDSKGNEYEFQLSYYLDQNDKAISVTPTFKCKSGNCPIKYFRGYLDNQALDLGELLKNCYNQNDKECPKVKLDEQSNYLEVEYCRSWFNSGGTGGETSDNPGVATGDIIPGKENDKYSNIETCTDVDVNHIKACGCIPAEVADITSKVYFVLRLIGPIALLIIGGFEMAKAVASQDESSIEKAKKKLVNKFIAAAAIFLVLTIIKLGVSLVADDPDSMFECVKILLDGYVI